MLSGQAANVPVSIFYTHAFERQQRAGPGIAGILPAGQPDTFTGQLRQLGQRTVITGDNTTLTKTTHQEVRNSQKVIFTSGAPLCITAERDFTGIVAVTGGKVADQRADAINLKRKPFRFHIAQGQRRKVIPVPDCQSDGDCHSVPLMNLQNKKYQKNNMSLTTDDHIDDKVIILSPQLTKFDTNSIN